MSIENVDFPACACSAEDIPKDVELVVCPIEKTSSDLKFSPNAVCHREKCLSCEKKLKICFDGESFEPVPYNIKLPAGSEYASIQDPPLDIAMDHAIGVIWYIFGVGNKKTPLDIPQLEMALQYLKTLQGSTCPNDVMLCIEIIENRLIDLYCTANDKHMGITFNEKIRNAIKEETAPETPSVNLMEVGKRSPEMWQNYLRNFEMPRIVFTETQDYGQVNNTYNSTIQQKTISQQHDPEICACCQEKGSYIRILQDWHADQHNRVQENIHSLDILGNVISQWNEEVCKARNQK